MRLIIVIPFCKTDVDRAIELVDWIEWLGGCPENDCVFVADVGVARFQAPKIFNSIEYISPPFKLKDETHPIGPNWMFETALKHFHRRGEKRSFLWLEPDAVPLRIGWLKKIEEEYKGGILADVIQLNDARYPKRIPSGVAVYPPNAWDIYKRIQTNRKVAWDIQFADATMSLVKPSKTIKSRVNHVNPPVFTSQKTTGPNRLTIDDIPESAVLFHPSKDGSLIRILREKIQNKRSVFYHSGDLGDCIYSLITVRELGGGEMLLGPDNCTNMATREKMTMARAMTIIPLLEAQPYIHLAQFSETMPLRTKYDLNKMRLILRSDRLDMQPGFNLARCYLKAFGLALENDEGKWLEVEPKSIAPVVIARSPRYHNKGFDWARIVKEYRGQCVFIGSREEHRMFTAEFGFVPHEPTKDLLEAARVIAGAKLFCGNQSSPYAIAEGLKKDAILEICPIGSNTLFRRRGVIWRCDADTILPKVTEGRPIAPKTNNKTLTVAGPIDYYTGIGRATCQFIDQSRALGWNVKMMPAGGVGGIVPVPERVKTCPITDHAVGPRILISPLLDVPSRISHGDIVYTMWESTRPPREGINSINAHASILVVPSAWCATVFSAAGVNARIKVAPLGVDLSVFKPERRAPRSPRRFGAAGRLAHGGRRKGIEDVIKAFELAFPKGTERVQLSLKIWDDCYKPEFTDKRISVITSALTDEEMAKWYQSLTCFVSLAKGEGWGLHVHEAIACGIPVIAPAYSGLADLVVPRTPFEIVEASEGYSGHWCQPDVASAANQMATSAWSQPVGIPFGLKEFAAAIHDLLE
jgi:glycosyltransferase involved in cell wall biosynthesis